MNEKLRRKEDPTFKLVKDMRSSIWNLLSGRYIDSIYLNLIGCDCDFLVAHLEFKFTPDMNWKNYGKVWTVDHVRPLASFDLRELDQQLIAFNYRNLQPLHKTDNNRKSSFYRGKYYRAKETERIEGAIRAQLRKDGKL